MGSNYRATRLNFLFHVSMSSLLIRHVGRAIDRQLVVVSCVYKSHDRSVRMYFYGGVYSQIRRHFAGIKHDI